jgi:hypothetical protein
VDALQGNSSLIPEKQPVTNSCCGEPWHPGAAFDAPIG